MYGCKRRTLDRAVFTEKFVAIAKKRSISPHGNGDIRSLFIKILKIMRCKDSYFIQKLIPFRHEK